MKPHRKSTHIRNKQKFINYSSVNSTTYIIFFVILKEYLEFYRVNEFHTCIKSDV